MAIEKIKLADGTEINVEEWLMWPLFSTGLGQATGGNGVGGELRFFEYIVGDNLPQLGTPAGTPLQAGPADTNQVVRGKINHDEGFIVFNMTYDVFALTDTPEVVTDRVQATAPIFTGTNLRRIRGRRDDAVRATHPREFREPHDLLRNRLDLPAPRRSEVLCSHRGEHGDGKETGTGVQPFARSLNHLRSTGRMHGEQIDSEFGDCTRSTRHGVGDVVELEIKEDPLLASDDLGDGLRAHPRVELEADLVEARLVP